MRMWHAAVQRNHDNGLAPAWRTTGLMRSWLGIQAVWFTNMRLLFYGFRAKGRSMIFSLAPMEGITGHVFRRVHAECFGALDADIRKEIRVISISGQQHGFVPLSADGKVLYNVKLWCDTSTAAECGEIEEKLGGRKAVADRLGNPILPGYTASKILWFYKNHRDLYEKMAYVLLPHDYMNWYLTGRAVMERGDASGTGLMNIFTGEWDKDAAAAVAPDLMEKLPEISKEPGIIGNVTERTASELGLSVSCAVASGGGDNMMSAIGTGAVEDGVVTMSLGTSGTLFASSSKPFHDSENRLASFCSSAGAWLPLLCTMNCTVASETMRKLFGKDVKAFDAEAEAEGTSVSVKAGKVELKAADERFRAVILHDENGSREALIENGRIRSI